ncbi:MAG: DUF2442 domain-containing protein [Acidobacteriota bacterium]
MIKGGKWTITEEEFERQFAEATKRGKEAMKTEVRATAASYDRKTKRLVIELRSGATHIIPCELIQGLRDAAPKDIAAVELGPRGASLGWEKLNQHFTVGGLVRGVYGTERWMDQLERERKRASAKARIHTNGRPQSNKPVRKANVSATTKEKRGRKAA